MREKSELLFAKGIVYFNNTIANTYETNSFYLSFILFLEICNERV